MLTKSLTFRFIYFSFEYDFYIIWIHFPSVAVTVRVCVCVCCTCVKPCPGLCRSGWGSVRSTGAWQRAPSLRCTHPQASSDPLGNARKACETRGTPQHCVLRERPLGVTDTQTSTHTHTKLTETLEHWRCFTQTSHLRHSNNTFNRRECELKHHNKHT